MSPFEKFMNMAIHSIVKRHAFTEISLFWFLFFATILVGWNLFLGYVMIHKLHMNDFGKFYYSILAYMNGHNMYGPNPATLMEVAPGTYLQLWNLNPPHFQLLFYPLGLLSPFMALSIWGIFSGMASFASIHLIAETFPQHIAHLDRRFIFLGILCFSGTGILFVTGQLSLLLLFPITLAWIRARNGQWRQAGILLGLVCSIKPFLLIFVPYFFLRRQYSALFNFFLTCGLVFLTGFMVLGKQVYLQWLEKLVDINWYWSNLNTSILGFLTRTFSLTPQFAPVIDAPELITALWFMLGGTIAALTYWVIYLDKSEKAVDRAFSVLLLAALLISPLGWQYYLFFSLGPLSSMLYSWWTDPGNLCSFSHWPLQTGSTLFLCLSIPGLLCPFMIVNLFQPNPLATALLGSIYFWSLLFLWTSVIIEIIRVRFFKVSPDKDQPPLIQENHTFYRNTNEG